MANQIYDDAISALYGGLIDWDTDTIKAIFSGASFDGGDTATFVGNITTLDELSGAGYVSGHGNAGRHTLSNVTITVNHILNRIELTADDEVWAAIDAGAIEFITLHVQGTTDDSDARLLCTFDVSQVTNGGNITVTFSTAFWTAVRAGGS